MDPIEGESGGVFSLNVIARLGLMSFGVGSHVTSREM